MKKADNYLATRFKLILENLGEYKEAGKPENMHDLRVEMKKLKSLFRAGEYFHDDFNMKKEFEMFRSIFKKGGSIRSLDVMIQLLSGHEKYIQPQEIKKLIAARNRLRTIFQKSAGRMIANVGRRSQKQSGILKDISKKDLVNYLHRRDKKFRKKLKKKTSVEELHDHRKKMKEILYLSAAIGENGFSFYKDLQEALGEWHDKVVVIDYLKKSKSRKTIPLVKKLNDAMVKDLKVVRKMMKSV